MSAPPVRHWRFGVVCMMVSVRCSMHIVFFLLISASCWFSSVAFYFGVPLLQQRSPTAAVALLVPLLPHGQPWASSRTATPPAPLHKAACYAQPRSKGCPEPALGQTPERCNLRSWLSPSKLGQALSRSAASLSLHHTPLRHANMFRLVKACQNNPLNPRRKDLIKLFYSGIHAACWTAYSMTSSMTYECQ